MEQPVEEQVEEPLPQQLEGEFDGSPLGLPQVVKVVLLVGPDATPETLVLPVSAWSRPPSLLGARGTRAGSATPGVRPPLQRAPPEPPGQARYEAMMLYSFDSGLPP